MGSTYGERVFETTEIQRKLLHGTATLCSSPFGAVCKALWPHKTAEELASRVGCAVRTAAYQISGEHEPSARAVAIIVTEITTKRG